MVPLEWDLDDDPEPWSGERTLHNLCIIGETDAANITEALLVIRANHTKQESDCDAASGTKAGARRCLPANMLMCL